MSENEVWKDVLGYEGLYQVSNKGNVYSVERKDTLGRKQGGFILSPRCNENGYTMVNIYENGKRENKTVHRLVAEAFIPNTENLPQVNHIDEVKDNNNVENLEWCTSKHNNNHGTRNERLAQTQSKKVVGVNIKTGEVLTFSSTSEARRKGYFNISQACRGVYKNTRGILIGDGHTYKGHKWSYE